MRYPRRHQYVGHWPTSLAFNKVTPSYSTSHIPPQHMYICMLFVLAMFVCLLLLFLFFITAAVFNCYSALGPLTGPVALRPLTAASTARPFRPMPDKYAFRRQTNRQTEWHHRRVKPLLLRRELNSLIFCNQVTSLKLVKFHKYGHWVDSFRNFRNSSIQTIRLRRLLWTLTSSHVLFLFRTLYRRRALPRTLQVSTKLAEQLSVDPDAVGEVAHSERQTYDCHWKHADKHIAHQTFRIDDNLPSSVCQPSDSGARFPQIFNIFHGLKIGVPSGCL